MFNHMNHFCYMVSTSCQGRQSVYRFVTPKKELEFWLTFESTRPGVKTTTLKLVDLIAMESNIIGN